MMVREGGGRREEGGGRREEGGGRREEGGGRREHEANKVKQTIAVILYSVRQYTTIVSHSMTMSVTL